MGAAAALEQLAWRFFGRESGLSIVARRGRHLALRLALSGPRRPVALIQVNHCRSFCSSSSRKFPAASPRTGARGGFDLADRRQAGDNGLSRDRQQNLWTTGNDGDLSRRW
ncbi:MAG: hypothetical protein CRU78_10720 [Candidatus Accumulibacter phosphatis]|uniref:Uncharacterized protein n=1 Tax=Candidatus Accumulibacter phosphatis TaxID=327160 RepID=A0A6A7RU60_9PROT|nr:hypothetical protein [Candidatus Accumulibacter phosphatis]